MPRMIDLIRASAVPPALMQAAAKGALSLPPREVLEILVYLASSKPEFSEQAKTTLSGWDHAVLKTIIADPKTPKEVMEYFVSPANAFPDFLPLLLEDAAIADESIAKLAATAARELVDTLVASPRISGSRDLLAALNSNPNLSGIQAMTVSSKLEAATAEAQTGTAPNASASFSAAAAASDESAVVLEGAPAPDTIVENDASAGQQEGVEVDTEKTSTQTEEDKEAAEHLTAFFNEHAAELAVQEETPFQAIGSIQEEPAPEQAMAAAAAGGGVAPQPQRAAGKKAHLAAEEERGSTLQKIAKLDIKGRIQLAMRGNKEERSILVRDGTKLVALAVLDSPKITDGEVEKFAAQKNVQEALLRQIPMKRRFAKNYIVVRNLVSNPRTPIDLSLGLMKHILLNDLKNLSGNKEVSDTVRKLALKMFKQKLSSGK